MPDSGRRKCSVAILGSTGSIGRQALEVLAHLQANDPDCEWSLRSLSCEGSISLLAEQARQWQPAAVCCAAAHSAELESLLAGSGVRVLSGDEGLAALASDSGCDLVLLAIFGTRALVPLMAALESGRELALASKEALIAAGSMVMEAAARRGVQIRPLDSEHSALWQCLAGRGREEISGAVLTASGGPFRGMSRGQLAGVTYQQALEHPVWSMGAGITLNSATLFNKGLELIEAQHLFGIPVEQIEVLVHPQGQCHSMARLNDGSLILHAATPDMRIPIQYGLTWPRRLPALAQLPPARLEGWELEPVDLDCFPALRACRIAAQGPWWLAGSLVALNEELCAAFQHGALNFNDIGDVLLELAQRPELLPLGAEGQAADAAQAFPREPYGVFLAEKAARAWARTRIAAITAAAAG
ncbi:1-deoxy-D-xylulose-5-phosphate reductoisomerase [bacterium]|nr:1-deoxy-D-xylulose-5-phosphate reductoisomerase [bacterium]